MSGLRSLATSPLLQKISPKVKTPKMKLGCAVCATRATLEMATSSSSATATATKGSTSTATTQMWAMECVLFSLPAAFARVRVCA